MSRVIDKVKGLLAIAQDDNASDGEIQACLTQVRKLMDKHQLSEDDLATEPEDQYAQLDAADCGEFAVYVGRKVFLWESQLTMVVAQICGVKVYRGSGGPYTCRSPQGIVQLDDAGNPKTGKRFFSSTGSPKTASSPAVCSMTFGNSSPPWPWPAMA